MPPITTHYDAIVVGARAAGAATALQLARRGHRVLVLDRDRYGADTLSTHALQRVAVMLLEEWGVLHTVRDLATPAVRDVSFHYEGHEPVRIDLREPLYAPRRTVLDPVLADAAASSGAEVHWRTGVREFLRDRTGRVIGVRATGPDGESFDAFAPITIGADGRRSRLAAAVDAPVTHRTGTSGTYLYSYVECDLPSGYQWLFGRGVSAGVVPSNDGLATVFVGTSSDRFPELRRDLPDAFSSILTRLSPEIAATVLGGRRVGPVRGFPGAPAHLRRPYGPGWALVGDAGSFKDPISSHGITDALKDSVLLVEAADAVARGQADAVSAYAEYERRRDELSRPLLDAVAPITTYRLGVDEVMAQHLALSSVMKQETALFRDLLIRQRERLLATV